MKEPREFSDMSDYPQDGWGNLWCERPVRSERDPEEEDIEDENNFDY